MKADPAVTTGPKTRVVAGAGRIAFGMLALVALAVGYDRDIHTGDAVNFFFYFTDLSNLFGAALLLRTGGRTRSAAPLVGVASAAGY